MVNAARNLRQEVTHWPVTGSDGYGGFTFGTPVTLDARWETRREVITNFDLEEVISKAIVYLDEDINEGDYLALGDYTSEADPTEVAGAYRVQQFGSVTDLRNVRSLQKAWL